MRMSVIVIGTAGACAVAFAARGDALAAAGFGLAMVLLWIAAGGE